MRRKNTLLDTVLWLAALLGAGCTALRADNQPPAAVVVVSANGAVVASGAPIPYAGAPVAITLDGTQSSDADGRIVGYSWLKTGVSPVDRYGINPDAGPQPSFTGSPPPYPGDPAAGPVAQVTLDLGMAQYSLWVVDDDGATSEPATATVNVATAYMPEPMCRADYGAVQPNATCADCICTPTAMMGCLDAYTACFANPDVMFTTLCTDVIKCGISVGCKGSACYTGGCMAQIDAASMYMGGTLASCSDTAMTAAQNPCRAASLLGVCTNGDTATMTPGPCMTACN